MNTQPEALRLADELDNEFTQGRISNQTGREAAVELRRLHEENQALAEALQDMVVAFGGGGVTESHTVRVQALNRACQMLKEEPKALAQPEQEPVREVWCDCGDGIMPNSGAKCGNCLAAESAAREWAGLTDEQIYEHEWWDEETAFAVNKELKEKNGG